MTRASSGLARGGDHRAVDPLQQMLRDHRRPSERQRLLHELHRLDPVALCDSHFREPLQRVRLTSGGPEVAVQLARLGQLARREIEVTRQQRSLPDQRRCERGSAERTAAASRDLQVAGEADHLVVRRLPIEHVLGGAEVSVEDRVRDLGMSRACAGARDASDRTNPRSGGPACPATRRGRGPASCALPPGPATAPLRSRLARSSKSDVKYAYFPRVSRISASSGPPSVSTPSSAAAAVSRSPAISAVRASRTRSRRRRFVVRAVERLPIRGRRHRITERVQQVTAKGERGGPVGARRVRAHCVDERRARRGTRRPRRRSRRRGGGRAQLPRLRPTRAGGARSATADASELDQPLGSVAVDPPTPMRAAGLRGARRARARAGSDSPCSSARRPAPRAPDRGERTPSSSGTPDERDELVGVEAHTHDRDALQHLTRRRARCR